MAAYPAVMAGKRVLMIERGDWVPRTPASWGPDGFFELSPAYLPDPSYNVEGTEVRPTMGAIGCVGGASVFFGGASVRMREADFEPDAELDRDSGAEWPYRYADLEPFYTRAEALLGVAGTAGQDPIEPWRSAPYPQAPAPLAPISDRLFRAAESLGLHPFRLPLAINYNRETGREACRVCNTCDGFACAVHAKNDVATALIPAMQQQGLTLVTRTSAVRLTHDRGRVTGVECVDHQANERRTYRGRQVVVSGGAIGSPHLLLASGLDAVNPAGDLIGRFLMRHCNSVVLRWFVQTPAPAHEFHKHVAIHDYYFGHPSVDDPPGKLGCIQQWGTPQLDFLARYSRVPRWAIGWVRHVTGLIAIAEDLPQAGNRVLIEPGTADRIGFPRARVIHRYHQRDLAARAALVRAAKAILRRTGPGFFYLHEQRLPTFSHASGSVRMGPDPTRAPLDAWGAFGGLDNLFVADGSVFPRSSGVNPSLTIAANALRTGDHILTRL
jgi:choline dehydrogenase-like flavoprotein